MERYDPHKLLMSGGLDAFQQCCTVCGYRLPGALGHGPPCTGHKVVVSCSECETGCHKCDPDRKVTKSYNIHFHDDDDGPAATVQDLEAALWMIASWFPDEDDVTGCPRNVEAKEMLEVEQRDGKTFIVMPEFVYPERREVADGVFETHTQTSQRTVWRLEEVV